MANCYLFSRTIASSGKYYTQQILVYAGSRSEADRLVSQDRRDHRGSSGDISTYGAPAFSVQELPLSAPRVLTSQFTEL